MRRTEIQLAFKNIREIIEELNLIDLISEIGRRREKNEPEKFLDAMNKFSIAYSNLTESEKKIIEVMELKGILNPKLWSLAISPENKGLDDLWSYRLGFVLIRDYFPKLNSVFSQEYLDMFREENIKKETNKELITVSLPEIDDNFSSPDRLIESISSIKELYEVIAVLNELSTSDLSIIAIDSGSDKSFDFLGNVKVVKELKELILTIWDRIVFYRERKIGERIDLVVQALPIIENINESEKSGKIAPEQAELFRRSIFSGTEKFLNSGSIIPEIEENNTYNPRVLLAPEPKMLQSGIIDKDETTETSELSEDKSTNLTKEEQKALELLLKKQKGKNNGH
jgi:hypothetical protein